MSEAFFSEHTQERVNVLLLEIASGLYVREALPNAAYGMIGERQIEYFSRARANMETEIAHIFMEGPQQLDSIMMIKEIKKNGKW